MAAELTRPGVEVIQEFTSASPTIVRSTLVPFVCGPAKEIIEVTNADGTLNPNAKEGTYTQLPQLISQTSFPSPRDNIDEVDVEEATIKTFFQFGGGLLELERDPGESFLTAFNYGQRACARSKLIVTAVGLALDGLNLILAVDVPARANTTEDVVITFSSSGNMHPDDIVAQINAAVGYELASIITVSTSSRISLTSPTYGASSSVTIRRGGSANSLFGFDADKEDRVVGCGFRAQDQNNNTTLSPWIEWTSGLYLEENVATAFPAYSDGTVPTDTKAFGFVNSSGTFTATKVQDSLSFTANPATIPLLVGDQFWADGATPGGAYVMKVESTRFKLGTINTRLSTYDANGKVVTAVYDAYNVNTLFAAAPFAPKYAWFMARGLTGNPAATAGVLTGSKKGTAAETATITAPGTPAGGGPYALAGLNLKFDVTVDGVALDTQTFTFTGGPYANLAAIVAAVTGLTGIFAQTDAGGTKIAFSTVKTGAQQSLVLRADSTALVALGFVAATAYTAVGKDVEFRDMPAVLVGNALAPGTVGGKTLVIKLSGDANAATPTFPTTRTHTFTAQVFASPTAVAEDINNDAVFCASDVTTGTGLIAVVNGNFVNIQTTATGSTKGLQFDATSTCDEGNHMTFSNTTDIGEDGLIGLTLKTKLNGRNKVYEALFVSNSLVDAVATVNEAIGWPVASIGGVGLDQLVLTSTIKGLASIMEVFCDTGTSYTSSQKAAAAFGFNVAGQNAAGTGRPNPDFSIDISGNVVLGGEILRDPLTGAPYSTGSADTYIQYTGLRRDVSPVASNPGLIRVSDTTTLEAVLSPITSSNPLALGMFFELINAPGIECTGLGIDEISAGAPTGTLAAYSKAAQFIESEEIYSIVPLTHDETVASLFKTHALFMSGAEQRGERIVFFNPLVPTRANDDVIASGTSSSTTATNNQLVLDVNPTPGLVSRGLDPANLTVADNVFITITVGGAVRHYNVASVNGVLAVLRTTFTGTQNEDDFFSETTLTEALVNADWNIAVRGDELLIPGSTLPDKDLIATTVAAKAAAYKSRRCYYTFPDTVTAKVGATDEILPAYYACAAIAGMVASQPPQQGFTNFPMTGFTGVQGSSDTFSNRQLNVIAAGGTYILVQDAEGSPLISRMQCSTDTTSIESRELSITKVVDFTAKFLRTGLRNFIGTFNITSGFLDNLSTVIQGMLSFLVDNGVLVSADLNNLIQSKTQPDTVLVDITLAVPYPCNYIRLTLKV